ncbi:5-dehydro-4-deoxy-D-glucuronate isomerase [Caviibacter abscessus]|uniref:5-dehydro-4-deoxy-D-glucuronate isomerase n=1 Tax=Caviibacter abscessus TaxID=1766719 RepID=UPI0008319F40|nr:5-dehydro-4-deoxy-D-glucuronate isomerase [Caviibacter abscessus]
MKIEVRHSVHPEDSKGYTTEKLRKNYLIEKLFVADEVNLTYSHIDRVIVGGITPVTKELELGYTKELGTEYFLERRELGVINIGGKGKIIVDDEEYEMKSRDGIYIGQGNKVIKFVSEDKENPAKYYVVSASAHTKYPTVKIDISTAEPLKLGSPATSNERTIYKYINPAVCKSCQLQMGMTILEPNNVWNTMPCHTHERRMEVYLYFDMDKDSRVFHLMGEPNETRHIVMENEQAVISPSWSIHSGVGTSNYTFIWAMAGENQEYTDLKNIKMEELK